MVDAITGGDAGGSDSSSAPDTSFTDSFSGMDSDLDSSPDFGELGTGTDGVGQAPTPTSPDGTTPAVPEMKSDAAAKPDGTPSAEVPTPQNEPPKAEAAAPSSPPQPPTPSAPTGDGNSQATELDRFLSDITQNEAAFVDHLSQTQFKLSPEMVAALADGQGETVVPRIVAGGALWAVKSMTNILQKTVPAIIEREVARITEQQTRTREAEDKFFTKWPQLTREKHFSDIATISRAFHAANPKIGFDELVALTGAAVMAKHGIAGQPQPQTRVPGSAPGSFVPAAGSRVVGSTPLSEGPFAGLGGDYE